MRWISIAMDVKSGGIQMLWISIGLIGLIALNAGVSWNLIRSDDLSNSQKISQMTVIWLLPLIGAGFVYMVNREHTKPSKPNQRQEFFENAGVGDE